MSALHWAIPPAAALAWALLRRVDRDAARAALATVAAVGITAALVFLPLLLTRS
ncbi:hypothetical protein [Streptomyces sp. NRRL B-24484]|uniref:hypothetical protein n=1 Tax=Streptomyces sp. NRRL B-24484 TaxID=1463833 RepID=UPI000B228233|nr:hypothetical protein [Streptomyces sp. NRRL B-24484]